MSIKIFTILHTTFWFIKTNDMLLLCLWLMFHQQLRSYGGGATDYGLIRLTGEAGDRTCDPWFTRQVAYPLHHSGSYTNDIGIWLTEEPKLYEPQHEISNNVAF